MKLDAKAAALMAGVCGIGLWVGSAQAADPGAQTAAFALVDWDGRGPRTGEWDGAMRSPAAIIQEVPEARPSPLRSARQEAGQISRLGQYMAVYMELNGIYAQINVLLSDVETRRGACMGSKDCSPEQRGRLLIVFVRTNDARLIVRGWVSAAYEKLRSGAIGDDSQLSALKDQAKTAKETLEELRKEFASTARSES